MVADHQERERRRERLNREAAERAHEAATRQRKIESGAAWKGPDVPAQPDIPTVYQKRSFIAP
jgi:hypothetical protein